MDSRAFYGRKTTKVSTLAKACQRIEQSWDPAVIVVLPHTAGDAGNQDSDIGEIPDNPKEKYEPVGKLAVEKDIKSKSDNKILLL